MKIIDVMNSPWAISQKRLLEIQSIYRVHFHGEKIDNKVINARMELSSQDGKTAKPYAVVNGVAVIPITGVLNKNDAFMAWLYDGMTMAGIARTYQMAVDDPSVNSVILYVDSPGGTVDGTQELANIIYNGKKGKQVIAYSDGMIASAAYWIASAADKIYISGDTVEVGSIGVVATHIDISKQDEKFGEKWTEITAGKYKRIASAHEPLSDEGRQSIQEQVDHIYTVFVGEVARNRNISEDQALAMADGKIFIGKNAVEVGLVDGVATLGQITNMMSSGAMTIEEEEISMDLKTLQDKHPEIYQEAIELGRAEVRSAMDAEVTMQIGEAMVFGAQIENDRVKSILAQAVVGHEAIISDAIADGKSTAGDVAMKIVAAEQAVRAQYLHDAKKDTENLNNVDTTTTTAVIEDGKTLEEKCKAEWDKDEKLRQEFRFGGFDAYLAFKKNEGNIRIKNS